MLEQVKHSLVEELVETPLLTISEGVDDPD